MVNKVKDGFSLVEALISMLIISLFFVASTKVMTTKQKDPPMRAPHGYYECYKRLGLWYEHSSSSEEKQISSSDLCGVTPPVGAANINLHMFTGSRYYHQIKPYVTNKITYEPDIFEEFTNAEDSNAGNKDDLKNYLKIAHPGANVSKNINSIQQCLFVAW